jgi:nitrogen fixation/metabolism regulation signal transduction histidine kinase
MALCDSCSPKRWCSVVDKSRTECKFYQPFTNEEYIKSLDTEQLADVIGNIAKNAYQCGQDGKTNKCVNRNHCTGYCDYGWGEWLKQPCEPFS